MSERRYSENEDENIFIETSSLFIYTMLRGYMGCAREKFHVHFRCTEEAVLIKFRLRRTLGRGCVQRERERAEYIFSSLLQL